MENFTKKRGSTGSASTNYSMEMGDINDPNHIHFVSVGRVKD